MKKRFELEWDDDLGKGWMNIFNLESCLYSSTCTKKELIKAREIMISGDRNLLFNPFGYIKKLLKKK